MADDDDDDSFGDFTFASNQTTANSSSQIPVTTGDDDDDDWGDFNFIGNNTTDQNLKSPQPQTQTPTPPKWEKIKGALPLSLFGGEEAEDEEPVKHVAGDDVKQSSFSGNSGFPSNNNNDKRNAQLGINDLIANLYGPRQQQPAVKTVDNGNGSDFTARNSTASKDPLSKSVSFSSFSFHSVVASMNHGSDDEGGWEFMDAYSESKSVQNGNDNKERSEKTVSPRSLQDGSHGPNDLFGASHNGVFMESHVNDSGFDSKPVTNIQNGFTVDIKADSKATKNELNSNPPRESVDTDDGFGEFETAFMEQPLKKKEVSEGSNSPLGVHVASNKPVDLFSFPNGLNGESHKENNGFDFRQNSGVQNVVASDPFSQTEWDKSKNDENLGNFETSFSESGLKQQALSEGSNSPLNLNNASNKPVDLFSFPNGINGESHKENNGFDFNKQNSWNKSKDDENLRKFEITIPEARSKPEKSEPSSKNYKEPVPLSIFGIEEEPEVDNSLNLQHELFKSSSHGKHTRTHTRNLSINDILSDLYSQSEPITPNVVNKDDDDDDNFGDGSWEFKDASFQSKAQNQNLSFKEKLDNFVDFYSNLKNELCIVARQHLHGLKKAQSTATLAGEETKVAALDKEIQEAFEKLHQKDIISTEVHENDDVAHVISLEQYIKTLNEPDFLTFDSEYHISRRLSLAESDLQTAIDLINHITTMLKIIKVATKGEPCNYVTEWCKVISVCSQELKHGTWIWKQSLQKNIHTQILSEQKGKQFVNALGEIYRVVVILGAAVKFYKPWILINGVNLEGLYGLLAECDSLWSNSGLVEVISVDSLLKSIKHIQNLDEVAIANEVFSQEKSQCQLSLLSPGVVPEMKMVTWNGDTYFVTLANLWANLISIDPPKLTIHVL